MYGALDASHNYGLGIVTTSYRVNDMVIDHRSVKGHTGSGRGGRSAVYLW